jgi:group I intron endonuclease
MIPQTKFLYKITNLINNKVYIGQTIHPDKRWWEHKQRAKTHYDNYPIHLAIAKYGEENFVFEILEESQNYNEREKELIKQYNSLFPNGYNIMPGGASPVYYGEDHPRNTISNINVLNIINELQIGKLSDIDFHKLISKSAIDEILLKSIFIFNVFLIIFEIQLMYNYK